MKVEELKHYGKDIISINEQSKMPFRKKLALLMPVLGYLGSVIKVLGMAGTLQLVRGVKEEIRKAERLDWHRLKEKGISDKHFEGIIKKMALAKVMAEMMGLEKAAQLRNRLSHSISIPVFEEMFAPAEVFVQCGGGDFLPAFKKYYVAMMTTMEEKGLEEAEVAENTEDVFQLNVTYCAWAEVARALGNPHYCYYSTCYGDEVFFPDLCTKVGFEFERKGTLAQGAPVCDFRFTRKR
jgi:hypothetical protein